VRPTDRVQLVHPVREPSLGLSLLGIDLGAFFLVVRDIGADPAMVLLTSRALALRRGGAVTFRDLGWVLGMRRGGVLRALRRLSDAGAIVWHEEAGRGVVAVELVGELPGERPIFGPDDAPPFTTHALPTHWFVQALPLLGRRAFLAYLYLRSRERRDGLTPPILVSAVVRSCRLRWVWQARLILWQLRRRALIAPIGGSRFAVLDPRPPSRAERRLLRLFELGLLPPTALGRRVLVFAIVIPVAVVAFALLLL
jgi:hypothetical protein